MSERELIALVDRLRGLPSETEWLELKRNRYEPQELGACRESGLDRDNDLKFETRGGYERGTQPIGIQRVMLTRRALS